MHYGISIPNFGEYFQPQLVAELAHEAEETGWDGFFVWDHMLFWNDKRLPMMISRVLERTQTPSAALKSWMKVLQF